MKPPLPLTQQVALLKQRGLVIGNEDAARCFLFDANYFRLSGYARQFQIDPSAGDNRFRAGTSLDDLQRAFDFDARLGATMLWGLGAIERSLRARLAYHLALVYGSEAFYLDPENYLPITPDLGAFVDKLERELERSKTRMVAHYVQGEDFSRVPIWVAIEQFSFGAVSKLAQYVADRGPRDDVAASFGEQKGPFASTIHSLAVLRNKCAHHAQIWHRHLVVQTPIVKKQQRNEPAFDPQGLYPAVLAMKRLLPRVPDGTRSLSVLVNLLDVHTDLSDGIYHPDPR
ncbi:MAG: Abi family protein [Bifidobacteriaceae bacterium]|nr:Abi family protein [Bifidobacteriaceae bacterium]